MSVGTKGSKNPGSSVGSSQQPQLQQQDSTMKAEYISAETKLLKKRRALYEEKEAFETEKQNYKE